jgi:glycine cleavage system regulatory protein
MAMMTSLVVTVIAPDRPGLVELLSRAVADHGGNWLESKMSRLAGKFGGVLLVSLPKANMEGLTKALRELESQGLRVMFEEGVTGEPVGGYRVLKLTFVGQDRPGIVRDVSQTLAHRGIGIDELDTEFISGAWSGENIFEAAATLRVPPEMPTDKVRQALENLSNELVADIVLSEPLQPVTSRERAPKPGGRG